MLGAGDHITASTSDPKGLGFLLVAGQPINELIVQHGPFVMNTQQEIMQVGGVGAHAARTCLFVMVVARLSRGGFAEGELCLILCGWVAGGLDGWV